MIVLLAAVLVVVGLVGIVVPVLPGLVLVLGGVVLWAATHPDHRAWIVVGAALVPFVGGMVIRYVVPGRQLRGAGVGSWTMALAVVLAVVGGLLIPVVGVPVGFIGGIFVIEVTRCRDLRRATTVTRAALKAVGTSLLVELSAAGVIITTWLAGLLLLGAG